MIVLKISQIIIGLILVILGFLIYFKRKYKLANDYLKRLEKGEVNQKYALNIGLIYFIGGIIVIIFGLLTFIMDDLFTFIQFGVLFISIVLLLLTNPRD